MVNSIFLEPQQCKECSSCWINLSWVNQWLNGTQLDRAKGNLSLINIWDFVYKEQLESIRPGHDFLSSPKILPSHSVFPTLVNGASPHEIFFPYLFWGGKLLFPLWNLSQAFPLLKVCSCCSSKDNQWLPLLCPCQYTAHNTVPGKSKHLKTFLLINNSLYLF